MFENLKPKHTISVYQPILRETRVLRETRILRETRLLGVDKNIA